MNHLSTITIDLSRPSNIVVHAKQNDTARSIAVNLVNNGVAYSVPAGVTAFFRAGKPDGTGVYDGECTSISDNTVTILMPAQTLAVAGKVNADVNLVGVTDILSSFSFIIQVEPTSIDGAAIRSSNDFTTLAELAQRITTSGNKRSSGTAITGTSTTSAVYEVANGDYSGGDWYVNTETGNVYRCTVAGDQDTAEWVYEGNYNGGEGDQGQNGKDLEFAWGSGDNANKLGVRQEGAADYTYSDSLKGADGTDGKDLEFAWGSGENANKLGVRQEGDENYTYSDSLKGDDGKNLEFAWGTGENANKLGVRQEGDENYVYSDSLKGADGTGSVTTVDGIQPSGGNVQLNAARQYSDMDDASGVPVGTIVQFVGETTTDYTNGVFYKRASTGWEAVSGGSVQTVDGVEPVDSNVQLNAARQYATMPEASADNLGEIIQYVGATNGNYINGVFYCCIVTDGVYSWSTRSGDVQSVNGKTGAVSLSASDVGAAAPGLLVTSLSLPTTGYSASEPYTIDITATGVSTDANKVYDLIPDWSAAASTRQAEKTAWNLIDDYTISAANTLTLTVKSVPSTAVSFVLKEVV